MNPPSYDDIMKGSAPSAPPYAADYPQQTSYPQQGPNMSMPMPMPMQQNTSPYPVGQVGMPMPMPQMSHGYTNPPQYPAPNHSMMAQVVISQPQHSAPTVQLYTTQQGQQPTVVVLQEQPRLGSGPTKIICPFCRVNTRTRVVSVGTSSCKVITAITCFIGFMFGGCCCIGLIPCLLLNKKKHFCPSCNVYLGEYNPVNCGP